MVCSRKSEWRRRVTSRPFLRSSACRCSSVKASTNAAEFCCELWSGRVLVLSVTVWIWTGRLWASSPGPRALSHTTMWTLLRISLLSRYAHRLPVSPAPTTRTRDILARRQNRKWSPTTQQTVHLEPWGQSSKTSFQTQQGCGGQIKLSLRSDQRRRIRLSLSQ